MTTGIDKHYYARKCAECDAGIALFQDLKRTAGFMTLGKGPEYDKVIGYYHSYFWIKKAFETKAITKRKYKQYLETFLAMYRMDSKYHKDRYRSLLHEMIADLKKIDENNKNDIRKFNTKRIQLSN